MAPARPPPMSHCSHTRPRTCRGAGARAHRCRCPRGARPRPSGTHRGAALQHGGQHSQGARRARAEVEEVQRRARRLLQESARELRVLEPRGVLAPPGRRGRRRHPLEGEQQQRREQQDGGARALGPRRGLRLPAGRHGRGRAGAAFDGRGSGRAAPALEEIRPRWATPLRPRGGPLRGARVLARPRPLSAASSPGAPPPRPTPPGPQLLRLEARTRRRLRDAGPAGGVWPEPRWQGDEGAVETPPLRERNLPAAALLRAPSPVGDPAALCRCFDFEILWVSFDGSTCGTMTLGVAQVA